MSFFRGYQRSVSLLTIAVVILVTGCSARPAPAPAVPESQNSSSVVKKPEALSLSPKPELPPPDIELMYDDNSTEAMLSSGGGGYLISFSPPSVPFTLKKVRMFGARKSSERTEFELQVWDDQRNVVFSASYPASEFPLNQTSSSGKWVEVAVPDIEVKSDFFIHVIAGSLKDQGIALGADDSITNNNSNLTVSTASGGYNIRDAWPYQAGNWWADKSRVNWMIRVVGGQKAGQSAVPPPSLPRLEPRPADFKLSRLVITPRETTVGNLITIEATVTNTGKLPGAYEVVLQIDFAPESSQTVTLAGGASQKVTFTTSRWNDRPYSVLIGDLYGSFVLTRPPGYAKVTSRAAGFGRVSEWSILYPQAWKVDRSQPGAVKFQGDNATATVSSLSTTEDTFLNNFVDLMLNLQERSLAGQGQTMSILSRDPISYSNNVTGADVFAEVGPGRKSRQIYILIDRQTFIVNAESDTRSWNDLSHTFDLMIRSFTLTLVR